MDTLTRQRSIFSLEARLMALKQNIQILQRHRRSLLFRLEPAHRSTLEDHVNQIVKMVLPGRLRLYNTV